MLLLAGLAMLVKASDVFTEAAEELGLAFGLSSFAVGVTIVAVGTSLPELVTSVLAVIRGASEFVPGNVVGSNIANLLLILGLAAILDPDLRIEHDLTRVDLPFLVGSTFLLAFILLDGTAGRIEGLICLAGLGVYLHYALTTRVVPPAADVEAEVASELHRSVLRPALLAVAAAGVIYLGAELTVAAVVETSTRLGLGTEILAATVVALGTSLPEVTVTVAAARRGRSEMAVGNVLGSNVFNAFAVLGVSELIGTLTVPSVIRTFAIPVMIAATLLAYLIIGQRRMTLWEGWLMILFYAYFVIALFRQA